MDHKLNRRKFVNRATVGVGSLLFSTMLRSENAAGDEMDSESKRLLLLGLNALARAHELNYFTDGHRGAAIISADLLSVDNKLDPLARKRISQLIDINWSSTPLCKPFPETQPTPEKINKIGAALMEGSDALRQVGHNAIFAMLAIKAFRMLPEAATPERIDGVCAMIRKFTPWRDIEPDADVDPPPFVESKASSQFVLREALAAIDRFIGFGQGFAGHMLTFGQAIVELAAMGDVEWAESCRTAFRKYVTVTRLGPEDDAKPRPDHKPTELRPVDAEYWQRRGDRTVSIGHVFKYPYAYYDLMRRAKDPALKRAFEEKAYHIF